MNVDLINRCKDLFYENKSQKDIAKNLGISTASVSRLIGKLQLKRSNISTKISDNDIIDLYQKQNKSAIEISKSYGVSNQTIYERLEKLNIPRRPIDHKSISDKLRYLTLDMSIFTNLNDIGAYYLGLLYADGCVRSQYKMVSTVSIVLKTDDSYILQQFIDDIKYTGQLKNSNTNAKRVIIKNYHFADVLCKYGMDPNKQYKRHIPLIKKDLYKHFVRGFLDGDGYISQTVKSRGSKLTIGFAITYKSFAIELRKLIKKHTGVKMCLYKLKSIWGLRTSHNKAKIIGKWIYTDCRRCLLRKYNKYKSLR